MPLRFPRVFPVTYSAIATIFILKLSEYYAARLATAVKNFFGCPLNHISLLVIGCGSDSKRHVEPGGFLYSRKFLATLCKILSDIAKIF
jgi:hypothetical protein